MNFSRSQKRGFTLIEVVLSVFVVTILSVAIVYFSRSIMRNSSMFQASVSSKSQIRRVLKEFSSEVRSSYYAWNGTYVIEVASSTSFTFYANVDNDKYTEKINYALKVDKIIKTTNKYNVTTNKYDTGTTTKTIVNNVVYSSSTPLFKYYDSGFNGTDVYPKLLDPVDVSKVRLIDFTITTNDQGKRYKNLEFNNVKVSPRNLKDNY